jgi:pimeloyl-ACP methyl ester carboxylesterase
MKLHLLNSIATLLFLLVGFNAFPQGKGNTNLTGNWSGKLELPTAKLEVIFKIAENKDGLLTAKMDVPMQGAKDIAANKTEVRNDSLFITIAAIGGSFSGAFKPDEKIIGTWKQNGARLPLTLAKTEELTKLNRPQTPKPPFPYIVKDVEYLNPESRFKIAGTLTIPADAKDCAAVILITGSGAQDRNETIFEHKPFWVIADYLTRNGIAVLRVDDRGVGGSEGEITSATSNDFATDVIAGIDFLKTISGIDTKRIGLTGHSEGGLIAPIVATKSTDVAFIILLAGPGTTGKQILFDQTELINRTAGLTDNQIEQNRKLQEAIFNILLTEKDSAKQIDRLQRTYSNGLYPMMNDEQKKLIDAKVAGINNTWFKYFLTYNPYPTLTKVTCPVLALNGEKDLQVPAKTNLEAIKKALAEGGNKNFKTLELENLNHLFQHCKTGAVSEYAEIEETISPEVLKIMADWILEIK